MLKEEHMAMKIREKEMALLLQVQDEVARKNAEIADMKARIER
jgi:hypothetical protein